MRSSVRWEPKRLKSWRRKAERRSSTSVAAQVTPRATWRAASVRSRRRRRYLQVHARVAAREAAAAHLRNIELIEAEAQTYRFAPTSFDALFSRFGSMFFIDPAAAFANLIKALKPGARLAFVCWRKLSENESMHVPVRAAMRHLPPQPKPDPEAPGPYAFGDPERIKRILSQAGFAEVAVTPHDTTINLGTLDQAVEQAVRIGPLGRLVNENMQAVDSVMETLRHTLSAYDSGNGVTL